MKPFLLLSIRSEKPAADDEYAAFCRFLDVDGAGLHRRQLGVEPLGALSLDDWSGIILGGGSFTYSDPEDTKSPTQRRAERDLVGLLDRVVAADFPFLGACYGIGTLGSHQGGLVDRRYPEPVGPLSITVTDDGLADPLFAGVPREFAAYGGHKEGLSRLPDGAALLATSAASPVQAFRVGDNVYATQFHPELDRTGIHTRIDVYSTFGYFDPSEAADLHAAADGVAVSHPMTLLGNFRARYAR
jgi:GMP synthase (glutamine-hydrolysing)